MKELVEVIAKGLVEYPDQVEVTQLEENGETVIKLHVAESDMGKVIGHAGRIAKAIRVIVNAAAVREDKQVSVDIE